MVQSARVLGDNVRLSSRVITLISTRTGDGWETPWAAPLTPGSAFPVQAGGRVFSQGGHAPCLFLEAKGLR